MPSKRKHGGHNISGLQNQNTQAAGIAIESGSKPNSSPDRTSSPLPDPPLLDNSPISAQESSTAQELNSDDLSEAGLSDEDFTNLAARFACDDLGDEVPYLDSDGEEVDDFQWKDNDPALDDEELQSRLLKYAVAVDEGISDKDWLPPEILKKAKWQKREQKGE
jgi:hypothetical protein